MTNTFRVPPIVLLGALVLLAYWPVFECGFIWDDDDYVTQNPVLRTFSGIASIWFEPLSLPQYYPLVHTTFWLEYRFWGLHPLGYHLVNVVLHLGSCIVLLRLLQRLKVNGALLAAALFAVHPVAVESVAWVTERKNVLSLVCALLAAHCWLSWREAGSRRSWWLGTALFVAALLAKTVTASLPAALLVIQWWRNGRIERRELMSVVPWLVLGLLLGLFTAWLEVTHVKADEADQLVGGERLIVAGRAVWFYLGSLLWPVGICFNYPRWQIDPSSWLQWLPTAAAVTSVLAAIALHHRIGRGPAAVLLLFGGTLVPALGFFDVYPFRYSYVADHFQYHAMVAMLTGIAALAASLTARLPRSAAYGIAGAVLLGLATLSNLHTRNYRDLETSWRATLACNPDSMLALINLGGVLLENGRIEEAKPYFERCLELNPGNYESLANLGQIAHEAGDHDTARGHYEASLAVRRDQTSVLGNYATLLLDNEPERALLLAREAVALDRDFYNGRLVLTRALHANGEWRAILEHADWLLKRTPDAVDIRTIAARALLEVGDHEGATQNAAAVLAGDPAGEAVRRTFVAAFSRLLQEQPVEGLAQRVAQICSSGGLDASSLLPEIAAELRSLGAIPHAEALGK